MNTNLVFVRMSINNVVLNDNYSELLGSVSLPFLLNPDGMETLLYYSQTPRQSLTVVLKGGNDGESRPINIQASDGYVYLTNKRMVFITASLGDINTFCVDLMLSPMLQFSHEIKSPWFGANYWQFLFYSCEQPAIASDGFPKSQYYEGKIYFNDGGLFNFIEKFNFAINDAVNNSHIQDELPIYTE